MIDVLSTLFSGVQLDTIKADTFTVDIFLQSYMYCIHVVLWIFSVLRVETERCCMAAHSRDVSWFPIFYLLRSVKTN